MEGGVCGGKCVEMREGDGGVGKHYFLYLVEVCFHDSLVVLPLVELLMYVQTKTASLCSTLSAFGRTTCVGWRCV